MYARFITNFCERAVGILKGGKNETIRKTSDWNTVVPGYGCGHDSNNEHTGSKCGKNEQEICQLACWREYDIKGNWYQ